MTTTAGVRAVPFGTTAIRALTKLGFRYERNVTLIRLLGWQRVRVDSGNSMSPTTAPAATEYAEARRHQVSR